jgi:hypothetical protein
VVQLGGQLDQAVVGGGRPEGAEYQRGQLHRLQAFALDVADQELWSKAVDEPLA